MTNKDVEGPQPDKSVFAWYAKRALIPLLAGVGSSGGAVAVKLIDSEFEILGVFIIVVTLTLRVAFSGASRPAPTQGDPDDLDDGFESRRDADIDDRNDARVYEEYRKLQAEAFSRWAKGEFKDAEALQVAKDNVLDAILFAEVLRLNHACKRLMTLAIIEDTGTQFVVKRSSRNVGSRIRRGMHCPHNTSLKSVLDGYARFHHPAEFQACNHNYYLVALSDVEISSTAKGLIEDAATQYQSSYQFFRMAAVLAPPASILPPPAEEL